MDLKVGKWYVKKGKFLENLKILEDNEGGVLVKNVSGTTLVVPKDQILCELESRPIFPSDVIISLFILLSVFMGGWFLGRKHMRDFG